MKSGEFSGRSVDEAVFHGLQELGLSIDEVQIETLQTESKGLFGIGAKMARVRLTEREEEDIDLRPRRKEPERTQTPREAQRPAERREPGQERQDVGFQAGQREGANGRRDARPYEAGRGDERPQRQREDREESALVQEEYQYSAELAQSHPAGIFLTGLLKAMGIEGEVRAAEVEGGIRLAVDSRTKGLLIGRRGETLDAMQYLTSLVVNRTRKQDKYLRVTLDTEDYRNKREETLVRLARRQAARVKSTGRPVTMEPMNPYERRVLHASLQNNPFVTTHSEGEEPNRRVVITPKK